MPWSLEANGNTHLGVGVLQQVLLGQPVEQQDVVGHVVDAGLLPLPDDALADPRKDVEEDLPVLGRHRRRRHGRAQREKDQTVRGSVGERLQILQPPWNQRTPLIRSIF